MKRVWSYLSSVGLLVTFILMLYLTNFLNFGYLYGYLLTPLVFTKKNFLLRNLDFNFLILTFYSVTFGLFYAFQAEESRGMQYILIYIITPPTFYLLGKYLTGEKTNDKIIFYLLFTIGALFSITGIISVFPNFLEGGFTQVERNLPNFWTGDIIAATLMGSFFTFNMCIPALLIAYNEKLSKFFVIIAVALFIISLICILRLGSRTQLAIFLLSSLASLIYIIPKQSFKKNVFLFFVIGGIVAYILTHVSFSLDADWLTTFAGRAGDSGSSISSGGGRTEKWSKSIEYLFSHPLGWSVKDFGFSHNMWLDAARVAGILPFLLLVVFSISAALKLRKTLYNIGKRTFPLKIILLIYGLGFFLILSVEPILDGMYPMFVVFCAYTGILNKYYHNYTHDKNSVCE